ncbi:MAG: DegV family protein [Oscillospiraceae bacterium]|nr:DegV family protein [Oscillospiraceae bacterium]
MNYKIVADSASNVFELRGVDYAVAPLKILCGEKEYTDLPGLDVSAMIDEMLSTKSAASTSCPNVSEWLEAFSGADCVFAVTITSNLSGSYNAAVTARDEYIKANPSARVHVFDTLSAGPEMRLIVEKLSSLCENGMAFDDIVNEINNYMKKTHLLFCLESLTNLARAGRVHPAKAKLAGILGIRVVGKASDEGTLQELHKVRGAEKGISSVMSEMLSEGFDGGKVRIAHCRNEAAAKALKSVILSAFPQSDVQIEECAALCSYYAEVGGLLIGYESK